MGPEPGRAAPWRSPLYGHVAILGTTAVSGFWAMVNEAFDPHAARRAMGRIGTGASIGGVLGAALTWRASALVPTASLLLGVAGLVALCAVSVRRLTPSALETPTTGDDDAAADPVSAGRIFAEVPYLRSLAALVELCALLEALLDYTLSAAAVARFGRGEALVGFFAAFQTSTGVLSLLVQAALVRWSLARLGLAWTLAVHPSESPSWPR